MVTRPYLSIILPTRDRPGQLSDAVEAILRSTFSNFEVVVVDQSCGGATHAPVLQLVDDERVRIVRDSGTGSSRARNLGVAASVGEILVFTDDDCEATPDWLGQIAAVFVDDLAAGAACGAVIPALHDTSAGFIVGYQPTRRERLVGRSSKLRDAGIGANMAFRREALDTVGGWDDQLGAGSRFDGAGDRDLVYRVLGAGYALWHLPDAIVVHNGFRNWREGRELIRGRYRGVGAAYGKHLRLGDPIASLLLLQELGIASANIAVRLLSVRRPFGLGRLWGLLNGFFAGFGEPIDVSTKRYAKTDSKQPDLMARKDLPAKKASALPNRRAG